MRNVSVRPCIYRRILKVKAGLQFKHLYTPHCRFTLARIVLCGSLWISVAYPELSLKYCRAKPLVATPKSKAENIAPKPGTGALAWANGLHFRVMMLLYMTLHDSFDITEH